MHLWERRSLIWTLVMGGLAIVAVPSAVLMQAAEDYLSFMRGTEPVPLAATRARSLDRAGERKGEPEIRFVRFALRPARAEGVSLRGDFTGWDKELPLDRKADGTWQIVLPLPPGTYHYLYRVDGRWTLDPDGRTTHLGAQWVSEKAVP